ncbi:hypothetical protein Y888_06885 [Mixta calida B021323]|uniref:Uncharacterized protein n=1 Tax=Mixta calida TaxID=665913 RepID=A0ABN5H8U4_9GAMM|nr:hypothetical protein PSNIH2_09355 [Pantoea sp. PSNIH2]AUY25074.1 hypothetical protein C2E16_09265 [Mixta calida]KAF0860319.1 hypothetical protein Y888_06885 [Mixta calida B021323]POU42137.1 hypothetical protein C3380_22195 [Pantoea sp. PSNIH5]POU61094.1 hypothetical protein C3374_21075 [Pantoea sp. PSNIH4]POY66155.1 hypothetical protein C3402_19560 [Pantoea sp. PSNIH3]
MRSILLLVFFVLISMLSIFLTGLALYAFGEFFFLFYKQIPVSFTTYKFFLICKISVYVGGFVGMVMWVARLLKVKGF